jgi:tyrosinase
MVTAAAARTGDTEQTLVIDLPFPAQEGLTPFTRADVVFTGVDHSGGSYEVRLFLNNPAATAGTPRTAEQGYAGRFTIFGHGGCYGDEGHCEVPAPSADPTDLRPAHPLTPLDTYVTIAEALRRVLAHDGALQTVTLVPVAITPRRADRRAAPELLHFADVSLQTYLTSTEADAEPSDQ